MKCPKCGYLGFETTDRCRHCGYDFSLFPFPSEPDLALQDSPTRTPAVLSDFDLPSSAPPAEPAAANTLDLDRLFGAESGAAAIAPAAPGTSASTTTGRAPALVSAPSPDAAEALDGPDTRHPSSLFEDVPLITAPRPPRPPLAVRRSTPELPRGRWRTTARPTRGGEPLSLGLDPGEPPLAAATTTGAEAPSLGARLGAAAIDGLLLSGIGLATLVLTARIAGLGLTAADLRVIPPVPFAAFLVVLALAYLTGFTVAGGQTIGKMVTKIRVEGDDGRSVDAADSVLRALGALLVPLTLGLTYVAVFLTGDHRALHDRLAGTRVVRA